MGYDISYHPISVEQMREWYFSQLEDVANGNTAKAEALAKAAGLDPSDIAQYLSVLQHGTEVDEEAEFASSHIYYAAVTQGLFAKYYYTRGTGISFMAREYDWIYRYVEALGDFFPEFTPEDYFEDDIVENYSGGLYIGAEGVARLLDDYAHNPEVKAGIDDFFAENAPVFLAALQDAQSKNLGLLEATDVIVPNPLDLNASDCYASISNCDPAGIYIYRDIATKQVGDAIKYFEGKDKK